jgi:hypothetical protein
MVIRKVVSGMWNGASHRGKMQNRDPGVRVDE